MAKNGNREAGTRELFWREHVAGWEKSGQSVRGYCRAQGLTESGFHFWKRELKRRDGIAGRDGRAASECARARESVKAAAFAEVRFAVTEKDNAPIEIVCSGERRVQVRPGFDEETLVRVLAVLAGAGRAGGAGRSEGAAC